MLPCNKKGVSVSSNSKKRKKLMLTVTPEIAIGNFFISITGIVFAILILHFQKRNITWLTKLFAIYFICFPTAILFENYLQYFHNNFLVWKILYVSMCGIAATSLLLSCLLLSLPKRLLASGFSLIFTAFLIYITLTFTVFKNKTIITSVIFFGITQIIFLFILFNKFYLSWKKSIISGIISVFLTFFALALSHLEQRTEVNLSLFIFFTIHFLSQFSLYICVKYLIRKRT
jgi:hypothetical protein